MLSAITLYASNCEVGPKKTTRWSRRDGDDVLRITRQCIADLALTIDALIRRLFQQDCLDFGMPISCSLSFVVRIFAKFACPSATIRSQNVRLF